MPRPRIHQYWIDKIRVLLENNEGISGLEIKRRLKNYEQGAPTETPSDRAIRRVKVEFAGLEEAERQRYKLFAWPESMIAAGLPWEASAIVLELVRYRKETNLSPPLIREALWFWRVSLAAPDCPVKDRFSIALRLASIEIVGTLSDFAPFQWQLAYHPWRSTDDAEAYGKLPAELKTRRRIGAADWENSPEARRLDLDRLIGVVHEMQRGRTPIQEKHEGVKHGRKRSRQK